MASSAAALLAAAAVSGVIAWSGPVDRPRDRGTHQAPTPTAGGLGIVAGAVMGVFLFAALAPGSPHDLGKIAAAVGFAAALGLFGALDDLFDIGARIKLLVQIAFALLFALFVARIEAIPISAGYSLAVGPVIGVAGAALWLVVVVNAVNFMDGANGLAPGAVIIASIAYCIAAAMGGDVMLGVAALAAVMAGLGFLPWNFPKARLFQGDAGALFSSFLLGALALIGAGQAGRGSVFVFFTPLALAPFLVDVLLTLLVRARQRKRLLDAHKEHLYQRWLARHGGSHAALAWRTFGVMAAFSLLASALTRYGPGLQVAGFVAGTATAVLAWSVISRRNPAMERSGEALRSATELGTEP